MKMFHRFRMDGRVVLITGMSRGLGRVMAHALAEVGANKVTDAREQETAHDGVGDQKFGVEPHGR